MSGGYNPLKFKLHTQVFIAMALGVIVGVSPVGDWVTSQIGWLGDLFMRLLRMVIVPLVVTSIISGVASIGGGRAVGRLFSKTFLYYLTSSLLAAATGLFFVNLIRPGDDADLTGVGTGEQMPDLQTPEGPAELILNIVPRNFIDSMAGSDMLGIIFFSIVFGVAVTAVADRYRESVTSMAHSLFQVMMKLVQGVMVLLPLGVFALITRMVSETGLEAFAPLAKYAATLGAGLATHLFITLPLLLYLLARISPRIHFANLREPLLVAFSTSSSAATLPVTMRTLKEKVGVSDKVSSFVLPMGATVNMDGTAVFECVGALFICQVLGFDLSIFQQMVVVMTALLASIGAAAVPSAGLVVIFIVLGAIGLGENPAANTIVLAMLSVDRPLDMCRTAVNVFSDSCGTAIIARWEGETDVDTEIR